jgi:hypothetical protein
MVWQKAPDFRLAFVTPSHQQPLSRVLSLSRRLALLDAADRADAFVVEDDYDGDFYFGDQPLPTLKSIDTNGQGDLCRHVLQDPVSLLAPWISRGAHSMVDAMSTIFSAALSGVPTWPQAIVADFIDEGHFATHIRTMRQHYKQRHEILHTPCPAARAAHAPSSGHPPVFIQSGTSPSPGQRMRLFIRAGECCRIDAVGHWPVLPCSDQPQGRGHRLWRGQRDRDPPGHGRAGTAVWLAAL